MQSRSMSHARSRRSTSPSRRGIDIPIEERSDGEVTGYRGNRWAPEGVAVINPVFDVTPAELVTALITEKGVVREPDAAKIAELTSSRL